MYSLPNAVKPYLRLMRVDKPIGTWLLMLPCLWGVALSEISLRSLWLMLLFAIGAFLMRSAGCIINDIYDRNLDASVERTKNRPLASGEIGLFGASILLSILLLLSLAVLLQFNKETIALGFTSIILVLLYPLMKRIMWLPQLVLGFTFNWGLILGSTAVSEIVSAPHIIFYIGAIFWTLGYDTIYAHQDIQDDLRTGIKSTAILFGDKSKKIISMCYVICFVFFAFAGLIAKLNSFYFFGLAAAFLFTCFHLFQWNVSSPESSAKKFAANRDIGLLILVSIVCGQLF